MTTRCRTPSVGRPGPPRQRAPAALGRGERTPILLLSVYTVAFKYVVRIQMEHYPYFLLVGLLPNRSLADGYPEHAPRRVSETVAMAISGHRTRAVFDRYDITSEDDLREAVQETGAYVKAHGSRPA